MSACEGGFWMVVVFYGLFFMFRFRFVKICVQSISCSPHLLTSHFLLRLHLLLSWRDVALSPSLRLCTYLEYFSVLYGISLLCRVGGCVENCAIDLRSETFRSQRVNNGHHPYENSIGTHVYSTVSCCFLWFSKHPSQPPMQSVGKDP